MHTKNANVYLSKNPTPLIVPHHTIPTHTYMYTVSTPILTGHYHVVATLSRLAKYMYHSHILIPFNYHVHFFPYIFSLFQFLSVCNFMVWSWLVMTNEWSITSLVLFFFLFLVMINVLNALFAIIYSYPALLSFEIYFFIVFLAGWIAISAWYSVCVIVALSPNSEHCICVWIAWGCLAYFNKCQ